MKYPYFRPLFILISVGLLLGFWRFLFGGGFFVGFFFFSLVQ